MDLLKIVKKQGVGTWIMLGTLILTIVSAIIYGVNAASVTPDFSNLAIPVVVVLTIIAIIAELAAIVLSQFDFGGIVGKIVKVIVDACQIVVPFLLAFAGLYLIKARLNDIAYVLFPDDNIKSYIQSAENLAYVNSAIVAAVFYIVTMLVGMVGAFFNTVKGVKKTTADNSGEANGAAENPEPTNEDAANPNSEAATSAQ